MVAEDELEHGELRLLEVDNRIVLPVNTHLRLLVTAADVLHSFAIPSLGIKLDACTGRLNQTTLFVLREGVFYGPKIDLHIKDAIGRRWQLTTIQIDFAQPNNFSLEYVNSENKKVRPVMIHRALLGSIERFTGILIEHYAGEFPGWLAPNQINILTIGNVNEYLDYIVSKLSKYRLNIDDRNIRLGEKIHESRKNKVPVTLIIGEKDVKNKSVAINYLDGSEEQDIELSEGIKSINKKLKKPVFKI